MQLKQPTTQGITLIEIIISISILAIGILGILQAFPRGTSAQRIVTLRVTANQLAQEKMESFSALAYDDIGTGTLESNARADETITSPFYQFLRTTTVSLLDENLQETQTDVGLKKITVTVSWPHPLGGNPGTNSLVTIRSK